SPHGPWPRNLAHAPATRGVFRRLTLVAGLRVLRRRGIGGACGGRGESFDARRVAVTPCGGRGESFDARRVAVTPCGGRGESFDARRVAVTPCGTKLDEQRRGRPGGRQNAARRLPVGSRLAAGIMSVTEDADVLRSRRGRERDR